jgi:hypothetical protein
VTEYEIVGMVDRVLIVGANILDVIGSDGESLQATLEALENKLVRVVVSEHIPKEQS